MKFNVASLGLKVNYFSWPTFKVFAVVRSWSFSSVAIRAKVCFHLMLCKQLMGTQHSPEHSEICMSHSTTSCSNCAAFPNEPGLFWITSPQWGSAPPVLHPWENSNKQRRVPGQHHFQGRRWKSICLNLWTNLRDELMVSMRNEACGPQGSKPSCYPSQFIIF